MARTRSIVTVVVLLAGAATAAPRHHAAAANPVVAFGAEPESEARADVDDDVVAKPRDRKAPAGWAFAASPYVWASSVQADVAFGSLASGVNVGVVSLSRHTRYGAEAVIEARHGRFRITADVMYGASSVGGAKELLSRMTDVNANVGTLLLDYASNYQLLGGDSAMFSLEARSGIRYQRTTIQGEVGSMLKTPEIVDAGADVVVGARAVVRPMPSVELVGIFDVGIGGVSDSTSSKSIDATVRLSKKLSLSAGWRSLTMQRSLVNISLSGPRSALQYVF